MQQNTARPWTAGYEWNVVILLALGSGLVGLDRFLILPLFPTIMKDLNLSYQQLGLITGSLGYAYGLSALFTGSLSDRIGRRKVVVASVLVFSLLVGVTGLAAGLVSMCAVRALMGLADGAYMTPAIVESMAASKPSRQGRNLGIMLMMTPLCGLALAPILATQLLQTMDWRWIFVLVTPLGLVVTALLYIVLQPADAAVHPTRLAAPLATPARWRDLFAYRNVVLGMIVMFCCLTALIILSALLPNYLIDYLHLTPIQMGFVLSAIGFGGTAGNIALAGLSDRIGRRAVSMLCALGAALAIALLMQTGAVPIWLFTFLLAANFFIFPLIAMVVGPATTESVPVALMASATGLITCVGELLGGGMAPVLGGYVAGHYGIQHIFELAIGAMVIGFGATCLLVETAPLLVQRRLSRAQSVGVT